ncbi:MAG: SoxR reducing system RseC family protein [Tenuifilaceae bacterium]
MSISIIKHKGVVQSVSDKQLEILILSESACSSCKSKKVCSISEIKEKIITIKTNDKSYHTGDQVNVLLEEKMGIIAMLVAYFIPFVIMMLVLSVCYLTKMSEPVMGIAVFISLILYYFTIYLVRDSFNKQMVFKLEKIENISDYNYSEIETKNEI